MHTTCLSGPHAPADRDARSVGNVATHVGTIAGLTLIAGNDSRVRVTPPLAFEAEEYDSRSPDENWRHRLGVFQTLDFPLPCGR
jgi:hypothetical protein